MLINLRLSGFKPDHLVRHHLVFPAPVSTLDIVDLIRSSCPRIVELAFVSPVSDIFASHVFQLAKDLNLKLADIPNFNHFENKEIYCGPASPMFGFLEKIKLEST